MCSLYSAHTSTIQNKPVWSQKSINLLNKINPTICDWLQVLQLLFIGVLVKHLLKTLEVNSRWRLLKSDQNYISTETLRFTNGIKIPFTSNTTVVRSNVAIIRHIDQLQKHKQREITEAKHVPGLQQGLDKEEGFTNRPRVQDSILFQRTQTPKVMLVTVSIAPDFTFYALFWFLSLFFWFLNWNP